MTGLESGADYYLTKPFDMQELLAVMKTILRRRGEMIPESLNLGNISLKPGGLYLKRAWQKHTAGQERSTTSCVF